jgi:hypothetical protein
MLIGGNLTNGAQKHLFCNNCLRVAGCILLPRVADENGCAGCYRKPKVAHTHSAQVRGAQVEVAQGKVAQGFFFAAVAAGGAGGTGAPKPWFMTNKCTALEENYWEKSKQASPNQSRARQADEVCTPGLVSTPPYFSG